MLKLEETVKQFLTDSSRNALEFPPSTSNYQVITWIAKHAVFLAACSSMAPVAQAKLCDGRAERLLGVSQEKGG